MSAESWRNRPHTLIAFAMFVREIRTMVAERAAEIADGDEEFQKELDLMAEALWC